MAYIYDIADTWNASGTTFTGIKLTVTDTASAAGSLLMDLQVGGVSKFKVGKTGTLTTGGGEVSTNPAFNIAQGQLYADYSGYRLIYAVTNSPLLAVNFQFGLVIPSTTPFAFSSTGVATGPGDVFLYRDAANTLAQRNGTNAQAFNLYNTYTDASNYERGFMRWVSNTLQIGTEKLGTGTARALEFRTDGVLRMTLAAASGVTFNSQAITNGNFLTSGSGNQISVGGTFGVSEGGDQGPVIYNAGHLGWISTTTSLSNPVPDLRLYRDAADNLAQRRGTNAQTSRLYGTYTDASNYRRLTKTMSTAGVAEIKPEGAGTGASGNVLHISGLPTSNPGPGILWNNAGTPAIGT